MPPGPPEAEVAVGARGRPAGASVGPGAVAGDAGREAGEWRLDEAAELWFCHSGPAQVAPPAMVGWVRAGFALPVGSPVEEALSDGATVGQILDRVRLRVFGDTDGWGGAGARSGG